MKQPKLSAVQALALKVELGLTGNKHKKCRKVLRSLNVDLPTEKAEKDLRDELLQGNISIQYVKDHTAKGYKEIPVGFVSSEDLTGYVGWRKKTC